MGSRTWTGFAIFSAFIVAGCGGTSEPEPRFHDTVFAGQKQQARFFVSGCELVDCKADLRFAVGDPQLTVVAEPNGSDRVGCLSKDWSVRSADSAVATVENANDPTAQLCASAGLASGSVKVNALAAGSSKIVIVDGSGAVVDELPFQVVAPATMQLHQYGHGVVRRVDLREGGDPQQLWATLLDAAGHEIAASLGSRTWKVDGNAAIVGDSNRDPSVSSFAWIAAAAKGDATLPVNSGPLSLTIPVHVAPR